MHADGASDLALDLTRPNLLSSLQLRDLRLKNRVMISPMAQYSATDGFANDWHLVHIGKFAVGGAGLVFIEATAVERRGMTTPSDLGLWSDSHVEPLSRIVQFVHAQNAAIGIQLAHAGRKGNQPRPWESIGPCIEPERNGYPIAPSALPLSCGTTVPAAMSVREIDEVKDAWAAAARRAFASGFDVIEIHGAHGYLIHQFLSCQSNQRTDGYNGSIENRAKFALEVAERVRSVWPLDRPLFFRMSVSDPSDADWSTSDAVYVARELKARGVDVIDCSYGGIAKRATTSVEFRGQGFLVPIAETLRREVTIPTVAVGLITDPGFANRIIVERAADIVAIGREALMDPNWPLRAEAAVSPENGFDNWPTPYGWWLSKRAQSVRV